MNWDEPDQPKNKTERKNLEELSIKALGEYIEELEAEIVRVREMIQEKEQARNGAESFFKV